jgi:hypothetical protein
MQYSPVFAGNYCRLYCEAVVGVSGIRRRCGHRWVRQKHARRVIAPCPLEPAIGVRVWWDDPARLYQRSSCGKTVAQGQSGGGCRAQAGHRAVVFEAVGADSCQRPH